MGLQNQSLFDLWACMCIYIFIYVDTQMLEWDTYPTIWSLNYLFKNGGLNPIYGPFDRGNLALGYIYRGQLLSGASTAAAVRRSTRFRSSCVHISRAGGWVCPHLPAMGSPQDVGRHNMLSFKFRSTARPVGKPMWNRKRAASCQACSPLH